MKSIFKKILTLITCISTFGSFCFNTSAESPQNVIKGWIFADQTEVDSMATQSVTSKALSNGTLYIQGSGFPYIFPFNGMTLTVGKEYILSFDVKAGEAATSSVVVQTSAFSAGDQYLTINTETMEHFEYQFTAQSTDVPMIALLNGGNCSGYYDNIYLCEVPPMPELKSSIPADGSTDVQPSKTIKLTFNNDMNEEILLNVNNYSIDNGLSVKNVIKENSTTYVLQLDGIMQSNTSYTLTCSNLEDNNGLLVPTFKISFSTGQGAKPTISDIIPADGSYNVALDAVMHVEFDTEMDESTLTTEYIKVNNSTENIDSIIVNQVTCDAIDIKFKNLEYEETYTVSFNGLKGSNFEIMDDKTVRFTTQPEQKIIYENDFSDSAKISWPQISIGTTATNVSLNSDCISAPNSMKVEFSAANEDIYFADRDNIKIVPGNYYTVSFYLKALEATQGSFYVVNGDNASYPAIINPTTDWEKYTVTYQATNEDLGFFRCSAPMSIAIDDLKFCEAIETKLMEESDIPDNFEIGISPNKEFKLVFNNDVNTEELDKKIKIGGIPVTIISHTNNVIIFKATQTLEYDKIYALDINLKDNYGKDIVILKEFKTAPTFNLGTLKIYKDYLASSKAEITDETLVSGDITIELADAENVTDVDENISVMIALYKNGEMIDVNYKTENLGAGQSLQSALTATITVPEITSGDNYELRAFLWRRYGDIRPISKVILLHN